MISVFHFRRRYSPAWSGGGVLSEAATDGENNRTVLDIYVMGFAACVVRVESSRDSSRPWQF